MSNYTKTTNFAAKDSLPSGNAAKIVKGAEIDTEFNNIATASATKADIAGPTFTGTVTIPTVDLNGGAIDGTTVGATTAAAITGTTIVANTSINIAGDGATVTGIKDEDDMSSNSATKLATQQSIKAYVDSQVTAQDLDVTDGSTSIDIDLDSESLGILGGTGIDSTASGTGVTLAIDSTVATLAGTQTLSNKTLSTPVVSGNLTTDGLVDGRDVATDGAKLDGIESGATADQTAAEIKTAYESNADTNAFTDADESKLDGIEASADVTDTANVTAAGALMDSELTSEASVKALNQGVATTDSPTFAGVTAPVTGNVTGNLTGNVTGNVTGNLTGDVTGDVTGDLTGSVLTAAQTSITSVGQLTSLEVANDFTAGAASLFGSGVLKVDSTNNRVGIINGSPDVTLDVGSATDAVHVPTGTTAQRPTGAAGYFRYNSSLEQFEGYTTEWGSIGGGGGTNTFTTDSFTGNGSTTAYALSQTVSSEDNLLVFIEGVFQQQDAYSIATAAGTTTLTFSSAPANNNSILIYSVAAGVSGSNLNIDSMTGDGSDVTLTLTIAPVNENNTQVFIDGVYQNKSTYSISGTTLTFSTAPPNGSAVEVMTMTQTDINVPVDGTITSAKLSGDLVTPGALDVTGSVTADGLTVNSGTTNTVATFQSTDSTVVVPFIDSVGSTQIRSIDGAFAIRTGGDGGSTANTVEAMRIDASGKVGIGTSSPSYALSVNSGSSTVPALLESTGADSFLLLKDTNTTLGNVRLGSASNSLIAYAGGSERMRIDSSGGIRAGTGARFLAASTGVSTPDYSFASDGSMGMYRSPGALCFATGSTERARFDSSGNLNVGFTSFSSMGSSNTGGRLSADGTTNALARGSNGVVLYLYSGSGGAGNITVTGSTASYNTSSDQRLKENIVDSPSASDDIDAIQVRSFDWKADGSHQKYGMVAQELLTVAPEAVSQGATEDDMMGVDYSKLVPMMIKEIQNLRREVAALKENN